MDGYWIEHELEHISHVISNDVCKEFSRQKTHEQYFQLVLKTLLQQYPDFYNFTKREKLTKHSIKLRGNGNKSFVGGQYYKALQQYTESVVYAINPSEELALAYANRSAGLYELKKYEDCLVDIDRVLNLKYPDRFKTKLYKRKGMCLIALERSGVISRDFMNNFSLCLIIHLLHYLRYA